MLCGELKEVKGERRIYVTTEYHIKESDTYNQYSIRELETGDLGEKYEGQLVVVAGKITKTSGSTFHVDDGSGSIKVLIKSSTNIETPKKKKGEYAGVIGIVSRYGDSYRILPRFSTDMLISAEPVSHGDILAITGEVLTSGLIFGVLMMLYSFYGLCNSIDWDCIF
jgi:hypothetical protein